MSQTFERPSLSSSSSSSLSSALSFPTPRPAPATADYTSPISNQSSLPYTITIETADGQYDENFVNAVHEVLEVGVGVEAYVVGSDDGRPGPLYIHPSVERSIVLEHLDADLYFVKKYKIKKIRQNLPDNVSIALPDPVLDTAESP